MVKKFKYIYHKIENLLIFSHKIHRILLNSLNFIQLLEKCPFFNNENRKDLMLF